MKRQALNTDPGDTKSALSCRHRLAWMQETGIFTFVSAKTTKVPASQARCIKPMNIVTSPQFLKPAKLMWPLRRSGLAETRRKFGAEGNVAMSRGRFIHTVLRWRPSRFPATRRKSAILHSTLPAPGNHACRRVKNANFVFSQNSCQCIPSALFP